MSQNNVNVAIILGAYNAENYIKEQLDSIINQIYDNWTLYIRDDSSSDNTLSIIQEYARTNEKIHILEDSLGNLGCNGNYFHILNLVQSDYYMFCNADDYWIKEKIKISLDKMLEVEGTFRSKEKPIIIHTDLSITDDSLNIIYKSLWDYDNINPQEMYTYNKTGVCNTIAGATMLFNNPTKKITFPVSSSAPFFDHWMALQVLKEGGVIVPIFVPTVLYRQIGTNLAAINMGSKNTLKYKLKNINSILVINAKEAKMLKKIGWGGYIKYICIKMRVFFKLRFFKNE